MKIFFTNPPLRELHFSRSQRSPGVIKSGTMYYPYWLAHAAALAESRDHEIYLLDCPADFINRDGLLQQIEDQKPDLIVLDTSTPSINFDLQTVEKIRQITDAKILMVGTTSHPSGIIASKPAQHSTLSRWVSTTLRCPSLLSHSRANPLFVKLRDSPTEISQIVAA